MKKQSHNLQPTIYNLKIGWLYPDLMSTYGDRGNIIVLQKRCEWRGIKVEILPIDPTSNIQDLKSVDLVFGGGSQDREQEIVMRDLRGKKGEAIKKLIENDVPALFVCGSPQLMGKYYEPSEGKRIEGLGIFDMVSKHPGPNKPRLIGNVVAKILTPSPLPSPARGEGTPSPLMGEGWDEGGTELIVGFENHGGRTYLEGKAQPFAKVIKGYGNNGEDGTEGVVYKNAIGSYLHGPLLPKNPAIADYLTQKALEVKYGKKIELKKLDDSLESQASEAILKKLNIEL